MIGLVRAGEREVRLYDHALEEVGVDYLHDVSDNLANQNLDELGLMQDVWMSLYKKSIQHTEPSTAAEIANAQVLHNIVSDPEFQHMKDMAHRDTLLSTVGMMQLLGALELSEDVKEAMDDVQGALDALRNDEPSSGESEGSQEGRCQEAVEKLKAEVEMAMAGNAQAMKDAAETMACVETLRAWGEEGGSQTDTPSPDELLALVKSSPGLQEIMKMAGRLKNIALQKHKTKRVTGHDNTVGVTLGDDLSRLLPQELLALQHPLLKLDAKRRLVEKQMMQLEVVSREPEGRGPLVICKDESASMEGSYHQWATATTLALIELAKVEKRACSIVHFASRGELAIHDFDKQGVGDKVAVATHFFNGGTHFEGAIGRALAKVDTDQKGADIIFITDGVCGFGDLDYVLSEKERMKFKFFTIQIGEFANKGLDKLSDEYKVITACADDSVDIIDMAL